MDESSTIQSQLDLTNCDREPIHVPGAIQSHGGLIAFRFGDLSLQIHSDNLSSFFPGQTNLLGQSLTELFKLSDVDAFKSSDEFQVMTSSSPFRLTRKDGFEFLCYAFVSAGLGILEIEPAPNSDREQTYNSSRAILSQLRSTKDLSELYEATVLAVRELTGFDRVTIYKFDEDWNGHVLAEAKGSAGDSYLDLHFPASDIPKQGRQLYSLNRIRAIPDVSYQPSKLVGTEAAELDLSRSVLRAVSPIHIEYLKNMPATASMSISMVVDGKLWGLVSCTHLSGPLPLSFEKREVCDLIGEFVSALLPLKGAEEARVRAVESYEKQSRLLSAMTEADRFADGLIHERIELLQLVGATGAALFVDEVFQVVGNVPDDKSLRKCVEWLQKLPEQDVYSTETLVEDAGLSAESLASACGLLAFPISSAKASYIMWFRPEVIQTVTWGGDPRKPVDFSSNTPTLHPRKSFNAWKETVSGGSLKWSSDDIAAARALRASIQDVVMRKVERISTLNRELERSNTELDSFAYAASHDLKEPLRGITNYATLLSRSLGEKVDSEDKNRLSTITRLTERMEGLINSLLYYSQIGRTDLVLRKTAANDVVRAAMDNVSTLIQESGATVDVKPGLPDISCDNIQAIEVFTNLISNAIKYNESADKKVVIGSLGNANRPQFYVEDNGIGIEAENINSIFQIFKRLHTRDKFGGGTGTGLTIAKKIIERHGGKLTVQSTPGVGSRFVFDFGEVKR